MNWTKFKKSISEITWVRTKEVIFRWWVRVSEVNQPFFQTRLAVRKLFGGFDPNYTTALPKGYELVFVDFFSELILRKEFYRTGEHWGKVHPKHDYQYADKSCINIEDQGLVLTQEYAPKKIHQWVGTPEYKVFDSLYAHGKISLKKEYLYGLFEIRCKVPIGHNSVTAFWLGAMGRGKEIDFFEFFPGANRNKSKGMLTTIHWPVSGNKPFPDDRSMSSKRFRLPLDISTNFHTYTCEWTPDKLEFKFDGEVVRKFTEKKVLKELNVPASLIIGNGLHEKPEFEGWIPPEPFVIQYIKIWEKI